MTKSIPLWLVAISLSACGGGSEMAGPPPPKPLHAEGPTLRKSDGRTVILRGINARVSGVFDVTFDDGRAPLETIPDFTDGDAARARQLGFNVLRLPINWSAVEPKRGSYAGAYLDRVQQIADACRKAGIYVVIDFHQDAFSKEIGEDGAPLWAIDPAPDQVLGGPLTDLDTRRTSAQVIRAFKGFFDENRGGIQDKFADMAAFVAKRFANDEAVAGFEIFNEPLTSDAVLGPFHEKVASKLRTVTDKLVFFEPSAVRNFVDSAPVSSVAFAEKNAVYAPHVYTLSFSDPKNDLPKLTYERLANSVRNARDEANGWGTPLWIGEFGIGPQATNAKLWLQFEYDAQDEVLAGSALWLWKEESQGSWGLFDFANGQWKERAAYVKAVSRAYVQVAGGDLVSMKVVNGAVLDYTVQRKGGVPAEDEVYMPENLGALEACCDGGCVSGASVTRDAATGIVRIGCGATGMHHIVVHPSPGP